MIRAPTPALLARRLRQTRDLTRLAELRRDLAKRDLAVARAALAEAVAAVRVARAAAARLDAEQQARRAVLVRPLIGNAALRGTLDGVLTTLSGDRDRLHQAEAAIVRARGLADAAAGEVDHARAALLAAERRLDVRQRLRRPLVELRQRLAERADEAEAEERRQPGRAGGRGER